MHDVPRSSSVAALLLAGGSGSRMGMEVNKVYLPVGGVPVIDRSLATLAAHPQVVSIVLVVRPQDERLAAEAVARAGGGKVRAVVAGGSSRHGSETNGLAALRSLGEPLPDLTLVHDGARPFLTTDLLQRLIDGADRLGGAVPGYAPADPVYERVGEDLVRADGGKLRRVQTPQVFATAALLAAYDAAGAAGFEGVDTADAVQRFTDARVVVVDGDVRNLKVTTAEDLATAEWLAARFAHGAWQ